MRIADPPPPLRYRGSRGSSNILGRQTTVKVFVYSEGIFQKQSINRDVFRQTKIYYEKKRK